MNRSDVLYRFYDHFGALLYVGITVNPPQRFRSHETDKSWWAEVAGIRIERHHSRAAVLEAEQLAIVNEGPRYNIRHNTADAAESGYVLVEYAGDGHRTPQEQIEGRATAAIMAGCLGYGPRLTWDEALQAALLKTAS